MSLRPSYTHLEEEEVKFTSELGWLAAIAFATVVVVAAVDSSIFL
jgi:hypothetical protein